MRQARLDGRGGGGGEQVCLLRQARHLRAKGGEAEGCVRRKAREVSVVTPRRHMLHAACESKRRSPGRCGS